MPAVVKTGKVPLERALSKLGVASRSQTRQWILDGTLKVNGRTITDPQFLVTPEKDRFEHHRKIFKAPQHCLVMLNKPAGYVTTRRDEKGRKTVYDLLPMMLGHLHPVGRLDMHTTGLLLLTTDTQLSARLTDPSNAIERVYVVTVEGRLTDEERQRLEGGIKEGGQLLRAKTIVARKISNRESHLIVTLIEGKNRELRRMFSAVDHEVTALKRIAFGSWQLGDLPVGQYKELK